MKSFSSGDNIKVQISTNESTYNVDYLLLNQIKWGTEEVWRGKTVVQIFWSNFSAKTLGLSDSSEISLRLCEWISKRKSSHTYRVFFYWFLKLSFCVLGLKGTGFPQFLTETKFSKFLNFWTKNISLQKEKVIQIAIISRKRLLKFFFGHYRPLWAIFWTTDYRPRLQKHDSSEAIGENQFLWGNQSI